MEYFERKFTAPEELLLISRPEVEHFKVEPCARQSKAGSLPTVPTISSKQWPTIDGKEKNVEQKRERERVESVPKHVCQRQ